VEHAATLEDIRAEVLTPDRLNTVVFGVFAAVALAIAIVGVAGVLALSVSGRTREFGIRLAIGSQPWHLVRGVIGEGAVVAAGGVVVGAACGFALETVAGSYFPEVRLPDAVPVMAPPSSCSSQRWGRRSFRPPARRASMSCRRCDRTDEIAEKSAPGRYRSRFGANIPSRERSDRF